jgi:hypothetical protein
MEHTPGLWRHTTRKTTFALCVGDFGVKYYSKEDALHLVNALKDHYKITIDWKGELYCGLTLDWHYDKEFVDVSMPGYVARALTKFAHPTPDKPQHAPHEWTAPICGRKTAQQPTPDPIEPILDTKGTTRIQSVSGTFLYYSNINYCIKPALNEISGQQAKPTKLTAVKCDMLMDYLHTYPHAVLRFHASNMIVNIESDAAYLVLPKARSTKPSKASCHQQPTLKQAVYTWAAKQPAPYASQQLNSDTCSHPPEAPSKPTIQPPMAFSHPTCDKNFQKLST